MPSGHHELQFHVFITSVHCASAVSVQYIGGALVSLTSNPKTLGPCGSKAYGKARENRVSS
jgi:hypothetical protein